MAQTSVLNVEGMTCGGCEASVQKAVSALGGVSSVQASHEVGTVQVVFDPSSVSLDTIARAIEDAGYEVDGPR